MRILVSPWLLKRSPLLWLHNPLQSTFLNRSVTLWNIIGSSLEIFGYLKQSSVIFGDFRKMFGNDRLAFGQLFENLWKSSESVRKSSEYRQKSRHSYVYIITRISHARLWIWILSSRVQLDISLIHRAHSPGYWIEHEDKIHIHARGYVILYLLIQTEKNKPCCNTLKQWFIYIYSIPLCRETFSFSIFKQVRHLHFFCVQCHLTKCILKVNEVIKCK